MWTRQPLAPPHPARKFTTTSVKRWSSMSFILTIEKLNKRRKKCITSLSSQGTHSRIFQQLTMTKFCYGSSPPFQVDSNALQNILFGCHKSKVWIFEVLHSGWVEPWVNFGSQTLKLSQIVIISNSPWNGNNESKGKSQLTWLQPWFHTNWTAWVGRPWCLPCSTIAMRSHVAHTKAGLKRKTTRRGKTINPSVGKLIPGFKIW